MSKRKLNKDSYDIGYSFSNQKGAICKVVDKTPNKNGTRYTIVCTSCFEDEELWQVGDLIGTCTTIKRGHTSCECSTKVNWKPRQVMVRVLRVCKVRNLTFLGFVNDELKSSNVTGVRLFCNYSGTIWVQKLNKLLYNYREPPVIGERIRANKRKLDTASMVAEIRKVWDYKEDTLIYKDPCRFDSKGREYYFNIHCADCAKDKFSLEDSTLGVFSVNWTQVGKSGRPCRCNNDHWYYSEGVAKVALEERMEVAQVKSYAWNPLSSFSGLRSVEVHWVCKCGCENSTLLDKAIHAPLACKCCKIVRGGYDSTKEGRIYLVRWYGFGESYLKFGITNREVLDRIKEQSKVSSLDWEILLDLKFSDGNIPKTLETTFRNRMKTKVCPQKWLPKGYTETVEDTEYNMKLIIEEISKYGNIL